MSETLSIDTLVVGGGVAGLFALDALVRAGHAALLVEREALGLGQTTEVVRRGRACAAANHGGHAAGHSFFNLLRRNEVNVGVNAASSYDVAPSDITTCTYNTGDVFACGGKHCHIAGAANANCDVAVQSINTDA
jgi:monoamine oxidase